MSSSPVTIKGAEHSKKEIQAQNTWQHSDAHHALLGKENGLDNFVIIYISSLISDRILLHLE